MRLKSEDDSRALLWWWVFTPTVWRTFVLRIRHTVLWSILCDWTCSYYGLKTSSATTIRYATYDRFYSLFSYKWLFMHVEWNWAADSMQSPFSYGFATILLPSSQRMGLFRSYGMVIAWSVGWGEITMRLNVLLSYHSRFVSEIDPCYCCTNDWVNNAAFLNVSCCWACIHVSYAAGDEGQVYGWVGVGCAVFEKITDGGSSFGQKMTPGGGRHDGWMS